MDHLLAAPPAFGGGLPVSAAADPRVHHDCGVYTRPVYTPPSSKSAADPAGRSEARQPRRPGTTRRAGSVSGASRGDHETRNALRRPVWQPPPPALQPLPWQTWLTWPAGHALRPTLDRFPAAAPADQDRDATSPGARWAGFLVCSYSEAQSALRFRVWGPEGHVARPDGFREHDPLLRRQPSSPPWC